MENYSLSDLKAITDGADGISGGSAWLIILFVLIFGGGGFGFGRNAAAAEATSTSEILSAQRYESLSNRVNQVGDGIASATFALNNSIKDGNSAVAGTVVSEGRAIQTQLADCCCNNQRNIDSVRYDMANFAASINSNIDNKFAAIEKSQLEQRLAEQAAQINQLQLSQALCGVPKVSTAGWGVYPYTANCGGCNCNNY